MDNLTVPHDKTRRRLAIIGIAILLGLLMGVLIIALASAGTPLDTSGYLDFSYPYGTNVVGDPTGEKPESKLWWNDGFWWGVMFNHTISETYIYRLDWGTQTWEDTGVLVDDRPKTKSDALWDGTAGKLYIVSHNYTENAGWTANPDNYGRLYRYTYDQATRSYSLDTGFPVYVNQHETETLVLEKDSAGRLWVTFVSRPGGSGPDHIYEVFANTSDDDGLHWGNPFTMTLPVTPTAVNVAQDDISSVVAFDDGGTHKIGIMWSNQISGGITGTLHFATHTDGVARNSGWTHDEIPLPEHTGADDHINLKSTSDGVFAAVKLNAGITGTLPLIGMVTYEPVADEYAFHTFSTKAENDTRPIMVIDEDAGKAYIFVSGKPGGSKICYKSLNIDPNLSAMGDFQSGDCGQTFIEDNTLYKDIDNATSMKANANSTTGIVVLAADDTQHYYAHGTMGTPPPVVVDRGPAPGSTDLPVSTIVTATFNQPMDDTTFSGNVTVDDGSGPTAGGFSYSGPDQLMTFTPTDPLLTNDTYTVSLGAGVESLAGVGLYGAPVEWSFSTISPTVTFSDTSQVALEDAGTFTITVDLSLPSALDVTVPFTVTGTAEQGVGLDYTITPTDTLVIPAGSSSGDIVVTVNDDALQENAETVIVTMGTPTNATQGAITEHTATIVDNDEGVQVMFSSGTYTVDELDGSALITVTLSAVSGQTVQVNYTTSDGSATAGSDYTTTSDTLTFAPGETSQSFSVPILDDEIPDSGETVNLTLSVPVNASLGAPFNAVLTITDDDKYKVFMPVMMKNN